MNVKTKAICIHSMSIYVYVCAYDGQYCIHALFFILFQMNVYLGVINRNVLRQFYRFLLLSLFLYFLFIYTTIVNVKDCNEMQLLIFSSSPFYYYSSSSYCWCYYSLFLYIQRINLNWDNKDDNNKRVIRQICLSIYLNKFYH